MKKITPPRKGKVIVHGEGAGELSDADISRRAQEIAEIEGRGGPSRTDRQQAVRELEGKAIPPTTGDELESRRMMSRDPSEPAPSEVHEAPTREAPDPQKIAERLVLEGVDEAQHEQMLADRRRRTA